MSRGGFLCIIVKRRLHYCGLKIASSSSSEGDCSVVVSSDWLFIESACVIEVGAVCSSSSGWGEVRNGKRKIFPTATAKATANHIHHTVHMLYLYDLLGLPFEWILNFKLLNSLRWMLQNLRY